MDVLDWIRDASILVMGAIVLYFVIQSLSQAHPGFGQYGWALMAAYIAGAVLYLKYGPSSKNRS